MTTAQYRIIAAELDKLGIPHEYNESPNGRKRSIVFGGREYGRIDAARIAVELARQAAWREAQAQGHAGRKEG